MSQNVLGKNGTMASTKLYYSIYKTALGLVQNCTTASTKRYYRNGHCKNNSRHGPDSPPYYYFVVSAYERNKHSIINPIHTMIGKEYK